MKNPIYTNTLKLIDNLKNSKGGYSEKNETLVEIAKKCISMKSIGCNFVVGTEYGKESICAIGNNKKGAFHLATKDLKIPELSNFLSNLSITMIDRAFVVTHNDLNQILVVCIAKEKFRCDWLVTDKNSNTEKVVEVENIFSGEKTTIIESVAKGKRPLNENDINFVRTAFNAMIGHGYTKELSKKVEKTA